MSLFLSSLNSGSNGNCYYVGNEQEAVLIDAGISCREIERRMDRLGLSMRKVKAVFISHEHTDHIRGVNTLAKKYKMPVFVTKDTLTKCRLQIHESPVFGFSTAEKVTIGDLEISAFSKAHDAIDPYSFVVEQKGVRVGVFTDIGTVCDQLISHFKACHAAVLEANYDVQMLENGRYPYFLKNRIRGGKGHLSNDQALELFRNHKSDSMSHLLLGHLSQQNNCPKLVSGMFQPFKEKVEVIIASRTHETPLFEVGNTKRVDFHAYGS